MFHIYVNDSLPSTCHANFYPLNICGLFFKLLDRNGMKFYQGKKSNHKIKLWNFVMIYDLNLGDDDLE